MKTKPTGGGDGSDPSKSPKPGNVPGSGQSNPAPDSQIMGGSGAGKVDEKVLRKVAEQWGSLPPERRAKVVEDITRDVPSKYRTQIEEYFKALNRIHPNPR
jgi:hypothetical protein